MSERHRTLRIHGRTTSLPAPCSPIGSRVVDNSEEDDVIHRKNRSHSSNQTHYVTVEA
ncbi:hypothetical protein HMPREF9997_01349 [Corynebacterium durum F0235]|uniref:Uncharacterized protein n=1 Tax=Corynebacterium durum F0235 TaxID=1035195 RepID=L1MGQ6_9CORY|nr:hypothetical protein HMPREF9997_01349 [Corynebacterium durum F0235]